jgi:hypothetical protein
MDNLSRGDAGGGWEASAATGSGQAEWEMSGPTDAFGGSAVAVAAGGSGGW